MGGHKSEISQISSRLGAIAFRARAKTVTIVNIVWSSAIMSTLRFA